MKFHFISELRWHSHHVNKCDMIVRVLLEPTMKLIVNDSGCTGRADLIDALHGLLSRNRSVALTH